MLLSLALQDSEKASRGARTRRSRAIERGSWFTIRYLRRRRAAKLALVASILVILMWPSPERQIWCNEMRPEIERKTTHLRDSLTVELRNVWRLQHGALLQQLSTEHFQTCLGLADQLCEIAQTIPAKK